MSNYIFKKCSKCNKELHIDIHYLELKYGHLPYKLIWESK